MQVKQMLVRSLNREGSMEANAAIATMVDEDDSSSDDTLMYRHLKRKLTFVAHTF